MEDDATPRLTRCFRGHSTPAGKTFCESCGASLEGPTLQGDADGDAEVLGDVVKVANRRRHPRTAGDVVPETVRRRIRFPRK